MAVDASFPNDKPFQTQADRGLWPWVTRAAGAGAGLLIALAILLTLPAWRQFDYRPYGGVVGPPAYFSQASFPEMLAYLTGVPLAALLGWLGATLAARVRGGLILAIAACGTEFALIVLARRMDWLPRSRATALLGSIQHDPLALIQVIALASLAFLLALPAAPLAPPRPTLRGPLLRLVPPGDALFRWLTCHLPIFFTLVVVFGAAMPMPVVGLFAAFPFTLLLGASLGCPEFPRKSSHVTVWLEAFAWLALALTPVGLWWLRLRLTFQYPLPSDVELMAMAAGIAALPALFGLLRRRQNCAPLFDPIWLLPFALFGLFILAAGSISNYDPFHQGEFTYPVQAMRRGLTPWIDVFIVHGLGANTLPGILMGAPSPRNHSLDLVAVNVIGALTTALQLFFLLRLWSRPWWLLAFVLVFFTGVAGGPPMFRYLPLWIVLLMILEFLRSRRLKWLALAGSVAWLSIFYSLDIGALLLVACGGWSIVWGVAFGGNAIEQRRSQATVMRRSYPAIAFFFGVAAAAAPTFILLWGGGQLREFIELHLEYLRVKHHYDKIPFALDFLLSIVSPAASVLGIWAAIGIVRRRQSGPLPGMILLLLILNLIAFARALDRSDSGHIAYASLPAWPLLASLVVWQARGRRQAWPEPRETAASVPPVAPLDIFGRSLLTGAMLMVIPYSRPLINNTGALTTPGQPVWSLVLPVTFAVNSFTANQREPLCRPVDDPHAIDFFRLVAELREVTGAPGAWSREIQRPLYDFSNEPAVYTWTGLTAPARFFAAYYTASEKWQDEVVTQLQNQRTPWVLWRGPTEWANTPDHMPNYLRQWKVAEYILANYVPARQIGSASGRPLITLADGNLTTGTRQYFSSDALLLRPRDAAANHPAADQPHAPLWLETVDLQELPGVFGRNTAGVPPAPPRKIMHADLERDAAGSFWLAIANPDDLKSATEMQVTFNPPIEGRVEFSWQNASGSSAGRTIAFTAHADFAGPYRVRLANLPNWVWGAAPARIAFHLESIETSVSIRVEWLSGK